MSDNIGYIHSGVAELIASHFHEAYERLAPVYGYRTNEASAVEWKDVPEANRLLMIATVRDLMNNKIISVPFPGKQS